MKTPNYVDEKHFEKLREMFPPLNKVINTDNKVELEELTKEDYNNFYDYEYESDEDITEDDESTECEDEEELE